MYFVYSTEGKAPLSCLDTGSLAVACTYRHVNMTRREAEHRIYRYASSDNGASIAPNIIVVTKEGGWRVLLSYEEFFRRDTQRYIDEIMSGRRLPYSSTELKDLEELQRQGQ